MADGEGGRGAWGGAEEGARWCGDSTGCCSLDEMPGYMLVEFPFSVIGQQFSGERLQGIEMEVQRAGLT